MTAPNNAGKPSRSRTSGAFTDKEPTRRKTNFAEGLPPYPAGGDDAALRLIRTTWGGILVSFIVELDGCYVGELAFGATLEVQIASGEHLLHVSGGGAFVGATERFVVEQYALSTYTVGYSWYGGVKLSRIEK